MVWESRQPGMSQELGAPSNGGDVDQDVDGARELAAFGYQ